MTIDVDRIDIDRTIDQINSLPVDDRLRIVEGVWDNIQNEGRGIPMTPEQKAELNRRIDKYEANPDGGVTWDQLLERFRGKL